MNAEIIKKVSLESGFSTSYIYDLLAGRKKAGLKRAPIIGLACKNLGLNAPKELWAFGSTDEIKTALFKENTNIIDD